MSADFDGLLRAMVEREATDLFLKVDTPAFMRIYGRLVPVSNQVTSKEELLAIASMLMGQDRQQVFEHEREMNFAFERPSIGRFRANVLWQKGSVAFVIRRVQRTIPSFEELQLPVEVIKKLMQERSGLILLTGSSGSGKSTTAASMLDWLNRNVPKHIVTLEDPIEFQFEEHKAIINQREVGNDTLTFREGLRNILRQSSDILFLSDIRDLETIESALVAAESGQLVLSCLHTTNTVTTVERLVAFFPPYQQQLIRLRLSLALKGLISLRLLAKRDGAGRVPACEILVSTPRVRDVIREGRTEELPGVLHDGAMYGMQTFTQALYALYRRGSVTLDEALHFADSPEELDLAIQEIRATRDVRSS